MLDIHHAHSMSQLQVGVLFLFFIFLSLLQLSLMCTKQDPSLAPTLSFFTFALQKLLLFFIHFEALFTKLEPLGQATITNKDSQSIG